MVARKSTSKKAETATKKPVRSRKAKAEEKVIAESAEIINDPDEVVDGEVIGAENEATAEEEPIATTGDTVVICSNYPHNIKFMVPDNSGRKQPIIIKGNAVNLVGKEKGVLPVGAFGITTGVPKEAWEWILKNRPDEPSIKNGNIFASTKTEAKAAIKERRGSRHGYEPINTKKTLSTEYKG